MYSQTMPRALMMAQVPLLESRGYPVQVVYPPPRLPTAATTGPLPGTQRQGLGAENADGYNYQQAIKMRSQEWD